MLEDSARSHPSWYRVQQLLRKGTARKPVTGLVWNSASPSAPTYRPTLLTQVSYTLRADWIVAQLDVGKLTDR